MANYRTLLKLIYKISDEGNQKDITQFNKEYNKLLQQNKGDEFLRFIKKNIDAQSASGVLRFGTMVIQGQQVETFPLAITSIVMDQLHYRTLLKLIYKISDEGNQKDITQFNKEYNKLLQQNKGDEFLRFIKKNIDAQSASGVLRFGTMVIQGQQVETFPLAITSIVMDQLHYRTLLKLIYKISDKANQKDITQFNKEYNKLLQQNKGDEFLRFIKKNIDAQLASGVLRFGTMVIQGQQVETFPLAITSIVMHKLNEMNGFKAKVVRKPSLFSPSDMSVFSSLLRSIYAIHDTQNYDLVELFNKEYEKLIQGGKEGRFLNYLKAHLDGEKAEGVLYFGGTLMIQGQPVEKFPLNVTYIIMNKVNEANEEAQEQARRARY